jgi:hypothetical protein
MATQCTAPAASIVTPVRPSISLGTVGLAMFLACSHPGVQGLRIAQGLL